MVLGVSFWERFRENTSVASNNCPNNNCFEQSACSTGSCNTCSTCQVQTYCPTCNNGNGVVNSPYNQEEIQIAVDRAVNSAIQSLQSLQSTENPSAAKSEDIQRIVDSAVDAAMQAMDYGQIANSAEFQTVISSLIGSALQNFETHYVPNPGTMQLAVNEAVESAVQEMEERLVALSANSSADSGQQSRAYDPNATDINNSVTPLAVPSGTPATDLSQSEEAPVEDIRAATSETSDDFEAVANRTSNFRSTETSFETSNDLTFDGSALKFQPKTSEDVLTVFRGGAVGDDGVFIFKRFGEDHTILAVNSPPSRAPFYGKESTLALVRGDEPNVEVVDFYNQDYPEAGVRQAGIRVIKEVGPDVTKSEWLPFAIDYAAHDTQTKKTTEFEVLKITPPSPQANVQVNGYLQIDVVSEPGAPPVEDCNAIEEHGRMKVDAREGVSLLYICTSDGWVAK